MLVLLPETVIFLFSTYMYCGCSVPMVSLHSCGSSTEPLIVNFPPAVFAEPTALLSFPFSILTVVPSAKPVTEPVISKPVFWANTHSGIKNKTRKILIILFMLMSLFQNGYDVIQSIAFGLEQN